MHGNGMNELVAWGHGVGFALYFVALWILVGYAVAWIGGWRTLAKRYRSVGVFQGERWRFRSGQMRWTAGYSGVLTIGANGAGLYLGVFVFFRAGHPPLFVPWKEVSIQSRRWFFRRQTGFILGEERIPLWVFARLGEEMLNYFPPDRAQMNDLYARPGLDAPRSIS